MSLFWSIVQLVFPLPASITTLFNNIWLVVDRFNPNINAPDGIVYINQGATGGVYDGTSWATAFQSFGDALASTNDTSVGKTYWIASGIYYPSTTDSRTDSFKIFHKTTIYGGFIGNEISINQRPFPLLDTILSGDIGTIGDQTDNSYHVMTYHSHDVVLNGIIIADGYADNDDYSDTNDENDCKYCYGGGIYIPRYYSSSSRNTNYQFFNCSFINNTGLTGGGIFSIANSIITIENSKFEHNGAINGNYHTGMGGGIYVTYSVELIINECQFNNNYATSMGGGIMIDYGSKLTVDKSSFYGNTVHRGNGGAIALYDRDSQIVTGTTLNVENSEIDNNYARDGYGGGIWIYDGPTATVANTTFTLNHAANGGGLTIYDATCSDCCNNGGNTISGNVGKPQCDHTNFDKVSAKTASIEDALTFLQTLYNQSDEASKTYTPRPDSDVIIYVHANASTSTFSSKSGVTIIENNSKNDKETGISINDNYSNNVIDDQECGDSWENACTTMQAGLDAANGYLVSSIKNGILEPGSTAELWVVGGLDNVYYPTIVPNWYNTSAHYYDAQKSKLIEVYSNIAIFGGFNGTETQRDERNWYKNPTFISGKLPQNVVNNTKVYQIIHARQYAWIDGFLIYDGYAALNAQTLSEFENPNENSLKKTPNKLKRKQQKDFADNERNYKDNIKEANLIGSTNANSVLHDQSPTEGGAIYVNASNTMIVNSVMFANYGLKGAAVYVLGNSQQDHDCKIVNSAFISNVANTRGGAISIDLHGKVECQYCLFYNNVCRHKGGAIYSDFGGKSMFNHTKFVNNSAYDGGGAIAVDGSGYSQLYNVELNENYAFNQGAALYAGSYNPYTNNGNYFVIEKNTVTFEQNYCESGLNNYFLWGYDFIKFE